MTTGGILKNGVAPPTPFIKPFIVHTTYSFISGPKDAEKVTERLAETD